MQPSPAPGVQVVVPGAQANGDSQRQSRPPSVGEALRFSPMTSAPIFGLDSIIRPDIGHPSPSHGSTAYDTRAAGKMIDILDNEVQSGKTAHLATAKEGLQQLLDGDSLTEFKFKLPPQPHSHQHQPACSPQRQDDDLTSHHLGPFARTVLNSTNVPFRYPSPTTPSPQKKNDPIKAWPTPVSSKKPLWAYSPEDGTQGRPTTTSLEANACPKPVVVVPRLPPSSKMDEYQTVSLPSSSKKRKLNSQDEDVVDDLRMKDQKEVADAALRRLQDLLEEIFEAEDQLQPDTLSGEARPNDKFFRSSASADDQRPVLSSESHTMLQKALRSVGSFRRLRDIPSDYINRLQKLCEAPILHAHSIEVNLGTSPTDADVETWVRNLDSLHNCLLSIGTVLHTMSGSQDVGDLCPEDIVQAIPVALNHAFDNCIIPAVESRPHGKNADLFGIFSNRKQVLSSLIHQTRKIMGLLANFISSVDLAEDTITTIEFFITKLIFVENAHNDKESALGFQKYESVRRGAMDVLAQIFAKYPDQRPFILDEILVSLEKLPSNKQSARQFKLTDGRHIQLLSALVIQLVQTTALQKSHSSRRSKRRLPLPEKRIDAGLEESDHKDEDAESDNNERGSPLDRLSREIEPLFDNAVRSAQYITRYIVQRAMTSTKTGDQPYRNILDLFTEDLMSVLGSPEWPGAELLLRVMASQMVGIAEHDKSQANAKNMALELLGWMGSTISELTSTTKHLSNITDEHNEELMDYLRQLHDDHSSRSLHVENLIVLDGPYRAALEYLEERDVGQAQLSSARGYILAQWGKTVCSVYLHQEDKEATSNDHNVESLAKAVNNILSSPRWLQVNCEFERIPTQQARLAYLLTVLSNGFCKAFDTIVKVLLGSITSEQAKVRSRSLKSVIQMLERDSSLLDRDDSVVSLVFRCATDSSPMVRDSALTLIAKLITLKPKLEEDCTRAILTCSADQTLGVRKRCVGLMKDIYNRTERHDLRLSVIEQLLQRMTDHEETVVALARQVLEEMLFTPFHQSIDAIQSSPQVKVSLEKLVTLLVDCVGQSNNVAPTLELLVKQLLVTNEKATSHNFPVCKAIVASLFERVVHNTDSEDKPTLPALLQSITVFAKAKASVFTPDQLETLHPYIGHLSSADDLLLFRSAVVIYRCVLPYLSTAHSTLLKDVQNDLFKSVAKLARTELNEVMACLWTINGVLQNTERLVRLAISVLRGIKQTASVKLDDPANADALGRVRSYIRIAGCVGKHCDLEKFQDNFNQTFPDAKANSVTGLIVDFVAPFSHASYPREVRVMALESLGSVCQSWPAQYGREQATSALLSVFDEHQKDLQNIVLKAFLDFFSIHEGKSEKNIQTADTSEDEVPDRLGGSLRASDNDGAAALIAQNFLKHMLHAAVSGQDSYAQTAIEVIASINRQGLIHPKECAGALVALETSTNAAIAKTAFETHKMLHQQHESMFDREYMRAVQEAFYYQRDVVDDPTGALQRPPLAKLAPLFEVIKSSSSKYQKKFLTNLCSKVDFDLKKLDTSGNPPEHLLLARFVSQNLAFFEYGQVTELVAPISCIERIVSGTGTILAHAIETEVFPTKVDPINENETKAEPPGLPNEATLPQCEPGTLRHLSVAATVLLMLWETRTYLRRLYGINFHIRQKIDKANQKELNKTPTKVHGVNGDRYGDAIARLMNSLGSVEGMAEICRQFATLLSIDDELKIAADDDYDSAHSAGEAEDFGGQPGPANPSRPTKRRSSVSGGSTPKKAKKGRPSKKRQSGDTEEGADFD